MTFRPEFQSPWTGQPQVTMLALNRLDRRDRTALVERIADGMALPDEILAQIVDRTDGVPLFIEELTKSVLETGVTPLGIPATLHDLLMARLDRLASVRRVAQIGAAIGREFSYELLGAVSLLPEDELQSALARLVASELVFQRGMPPDAVYAFKHALVQDAAHGSLLRSARQQLHAQIAEALETHSSDSMDSQPELFAQHYAEAGHVEKSIAYWGKAGHRSAARSAMAEAAAQFQKGLTSWRCCSIPPNARRQELEFRVALGAVLMAGKGVGAPQTRQAYARARELWEQLGSPSEFLNIPYGQSLHYAMRGELDRAQSLAEDLLRLSRQRNDFAGLVLGHYCSGFSLMIAGRFGSSRLQLKAVLALYDPRAPPLIEQQSIVHPQIASQVYLGSVLFCLGFPDQAMAQSNAAIAEAQRLAHPSVASNLSAGVRLLSLVGDNAALDERANELIAVATEQDFPLWGAQGTIFRGWGKVRSGDVAEGMALLRSGTAAYRATGAELWMPYHIFLLAGACELAGQIEEAVTLLDDALQLIEKQGSAGLKRS